MALDPFCQCEARRQHERSGEMYLALNLGGWVFPYDYASAAWTRDKIARPYVWTFCPFCGAALPMTPRHRLPPPPDSDDAA